jgi:hypothetical protein
MNFLAAPVLPASCIGPSPAEGAAQDDSVVMDYSKKKRTLLCRFAVAAWLRFFDKLRQRCAGTAEAAVPTRAF